MDEGKVVATSEQGIHLSTIIKECLIVTKSALSVMILLEFTVFMRTLLKRRNK